MMNTGAVSQPAVAAGEASDRSRNTNRQGGTENAEGGFQGLLAKLTGNRERADGETAPAKDTGSGEGNRSKLAGWLRDNAEVLAQEDGADSLERALAEQDGDASAATSTDPSTLLQALGTNGALTGGLSAIAARVANGTASDAETALMQAAAAAQAHGDELSTEQLVLASLAKVAARVGQSAATDDEKTKTVSLAVLRRETHFAPAADVSAGWAVRIAAGDRALGAGAQPDTDVADDVTLIRSGNGLEGRADAQLAVPRAAVMAEGDAQPGTGWRRGAAPLAEMQAAADAVASAGDNAIVAEQAAPVARSDALVNAGLAGGGVAQQIADRVAGEAGTLVTQAARSDAPAFGVRHESPVKVMQIQLQPEGLGIVTIRMSVKDQSLRLDLEVGRGETAHIIQRDREALSALLRSAGYLIDGVDVKVADPGSANAQMGNTQANTQMQGGGQSGSSQAEARSPGARPQDERGNNAFGNERNGEHEQAGQTPRRGGIYI